MKMLKILSVIFGSFAANSPQTPELMAASEDFFSYSLSSIKTPFVTGEYQYAAKKGDSLSNILDKHKVHPNDAKKIVDAISERVDLRSLKIGTNFDVMINYDSSFKSSLSSIGFQLANKEITIVKSLSGKYITKITPISSSVKVVRKQGYVKSTIDSLGRDLNIPASLLLSYVNAFKDEVNFTRDIKKGTEIELLYEQYYDKKGKKVKDGNILFASLKIGNKKRELYGFSSSNNKRNYSFYKADGSKNGKSKSFFGRPYKGKPRITSHFGMRIHPIYKKKRAHKGVDYGMKTGTPIYATADGKVLRAGRNGGYGNYIRIKHSMGYQTAYAHCHKIAKGIKKGTRVKKGDLIGYVGSTGNSTGPHLHYEIIKNGRHINPLSVKIAEPRKLPSSKRLAFNQHKKKVNNLRKQAVAVAD